MHAGLGDCCDAQPVSRACPVLAGPGPCIAACRVSPREPLVEIPTSHF